MRLVYFVTHPEVVIDPAVPVPQPLYEPALSRLGERLGVGKLLDDGVRLLRFGRGVDNTRLVDEVGYEPVYDAEGAARDFARAVRSRTIGPALHPGALIDRLSGASR